MICTLCPRNCQIDRSLGKGFCGEKEKIRLSKIIEHFEWEEPCVSGDKGALALFFSGCNLRCEFCQNYEISHIGKGQEYSEDEFVRFLSSFDFSKFSSLDLVSPSQFSLQISSALKRVKIPIPVVWNSNGYEKTDTLKEISKVTDVFLVDLKFYDEKLSQSLCGAKDYFEVASKAVKLMSELKPNIFKNGLMTQGVIIRHLILPGQVKDSFKILDFIKAEINSPIISLMSQFTPTGNGRLNRKITPLEYKTVLSHAQKLGLENGFFQDLESASTSFIPKF